MPQKTSKNVRQYFRWEVLIPLLVLLAVALHDWKSQTAFRAVIDGDSMSPTYSDREIVWATSLYSHIVKGDVVVLQFNNESTIIKRVVYVPGETFWVMQSDAIHWEPIPKDTVKTFQDLKLWPVRKISVPPGMFWLEGDNHSVSYDSRVYGLFEMQYIKGVVVPWRAVTNPEPMSSPVKRVYELRKQDKPITREKFIGKNATGSHL